MKKILILSAFISLVILNFSPKIYADSTDIQTKIEADTANYAENTIDEEENGTVAKGKLHAKIKEKFIDGGPVFMSFILISLILGLALAVERIIYLNFAETDNQKLLLNIEKALENGGTEAAKTVCRNTKGPVAGIFYQGLDRANQGIEIVEKTVISYGSVQAELLEKGLTWISLFISLAPMLGFLGTVIGMIDAFDKIENADDIRPGLVAGGIKIALITTVGGLIVAMILQVFYNYIVSKIDNIINEMEDASISLIDILVKHYNK